MKQELNVLQVKKLFEIIVINGELRWGMLDYKIKMSFAIRMLFFKQ